MSDSPRSDDTRAQEKADQRKPETDLELWKHFAGMGSTDKNTMVTTVSWLLAFSAAAIGYIVTNTQMSWTTFPIIQYSERMRMMTVSLLGVLVSGVAGYLAILYAGYSNRNWAKADEIARGHNWLDLLPEWAPDKMTPGRGGKPGCVATIAWKCARPYYPQTELALVFKIFLGLALFSGIVHSVLVFWSGYFLFLR